MSSPPTPPGTFVTGKVADMCARPVAGALVRLHCGPQVGVVAEGRTTEDGRFELLLPWSFYTCHVLIEAAGMVECVAYWWGPGRPLDVRLIEGVAFRVRAVDQVGNPVPGAEVGLFNAGGSTSARTDDDGVADLWEVSLGSHRLWVFHPEYQALVRELSLSEESLFEVRLGAPVERVLRLTIVGASAAGLRKARCSIEFEAKEGKPLGFPRLAEEWRRLDSDGVWTLKGLPFDVACRVSVDLPGMVLTPSRFSLVAHQDTGPLELSVTAKRRRLRSVRGRVLGEGGAGLGGVTLHAYCEDRRHQLVVTDEEGCFVVKTGIADGQILRLWLAPGPRRIDSPASLHFHRRSSRHLHVLKMPCAGRLVLPTSPNRMLQGRFIRPDGSGLESSEVLLFRGDDSAGLGEVEPCLRTVVGPDGEFSIAEHELPTGPMFVVASCSGWRGRSRLVELGEGQVELNLVIVAEPKPEIAVAEGERAEVAAIHGVILDADGHPVVGAFVVARRGVPLDDSAASRCRERASTMRDGAFALGDLEPGTWYVGVLDLDEAVHWRSEPLAVGPGEEHRVTFVMPALP